MENNFEERSQKKLLDWLVKSANHKHAMHYADESEYDHFIRDRNMLQFARHEIIRLEEEVAELRLENK